MTRRERQPRANPASYKCANPDCERSTPLDVREDAFDGLTDVPSELTHYVTEAPDIPGFTIICSTCGHLTVVRPSRKP